MKFGRLLKTTSVDLPEMEALFSAYKTLKKHVKRLPFKEQLGQSGTLENLTEEENNFCKALSDTLHQLNDMFLAKEETSVIRVERLEHDLAAPSSPEQLNNLHKQFVDFHGEVLLLVHWSILAYTATVKILKKHHKRTGLLVKAPQLGNLLSQPFCSTELMTSIAHRVEEDIQRLAERMGVSGQRNSEPTEQQQQHPVRHVAAAAGAELPQLSNGGLDIQLLQQLADSGSLTTPSDSSMFQEEDTAHTSSKRTYHHQQQQQQQHLQECSQQAHLQDGGAVSEVQSISKRRRTAAAAAAPADSVSQAAMDAGCRAGACAAAVDQVDSAAASQQQAGLQAQAAVPAVGQAEGAAAAAAAQQQRLPANSLVLHHRCSSTGCSDAHEQQHQQQQEQQLQEPNDLEPTASMSGCSTCGRQCSIMRQTQVALTTWKHLQSTASTPSTVVPNYRLLHRSNTARTESSAA